MNPERRQRTGALLAGGAAILLIGSLFLEWYTLELPARIRNVEAPAFTAFEGLDRADVAIVVAAGLGAIIAVLVVAGILDRSPAPGVALVALGLFALAVVIYRGVISPPGLVLFGVGLEMNVSFGWFVSVVLAVLMVIGGALTCRPTILSRRDG